jgi:CBS domain-containing protein
MTANVISVPYDMDLRNLAKLFIEKKITGAPVVDGMGELIGVISESDLVAYTLTRDDELVMDSTFYETARIEAHRIPKGYQIEDVNTREVSEIMTPVVHSVTEDATLADVARLMTDNHIHRAIVRRDEKPVGVISALDLLRAFAG